MGAGASVCPKPLAFSFAQGIRAMSGGHKIVYTITDEAPMLATYAFLPIIKRFTDPCGITVEKSDISVAARVLAHFPGTMCIHVRVSVCLCVCVCVQYFSMLRIAGTASAELHVYIMYVCIYMYTCYINCMYVHVYMYITCYINVHYMSYQ